MDIALDAPPSPLLVELRDRATDIRLVQDTGELLYWDDRMSRPRLASAGEWRAKQRALHAEHLHDVATSADLDAAITRVEDAGDGAGSTASLEAAAMRRDLEHRRRVPRAIWAAREAASSVALAAWHEARAARSAASWLPALSTMVDEVRRYADAAGYVAEPYEACLAEWEPGIDLPTVDRCFAALLEGLRPLRRAASTDASAALPVGLTTRPLPVDVIRAIESDAVQAVGFDPARGALVPSERAFCLPLGPDDVRMTTRLYETPGIRGIHSTLHEAGHAIYAQSFARLGVPATLAQAPGLGLDEAQSRMVENAIGRSRAFATWLFGRMRVHAPAAYPDAGELSGLLRETVRAEHPLRRLGADEASYDLHVLLRMRLERALVNGTLRVAELPDAWDAASEELLGGRPVDDLDGCLQDVHWSLGQWGYFPTYTLGNVYGSQLLEQARADIGAAALDADLEASGDTRRLRDWIDEHVNRHGRAFHGRELVERVTGQPLDPEAHVRAVARRLAEAR